MTSELLFSVSPLMALFLTSVLLLIARAFNANLLFTFLLSILGIISAFLLTLTINTQGENRLSLLFLVDDYAIFMTQIMLLFSLMVLTFSFDYWQNLGRNFHEFFISLILSAAGALVLASSDHFVSFFLGFELLTIPLYCILGYFTHKEKCLEAAIKYLILAGTSSALLLFGMALIFAEVGSMSFVEIINHISGDYSSFSPLFIAGFALIFSAIAFKISAVPFHMWTPDVYAGAPLPATAYLATVSKTAVLAVFLRLWMPISDHLGPDAKLLLDLMAALSMLLGNLLALRQDNIKSLIGYSSIANFGYIFMAMLCLGSSGFEATLFYIAAYCCTTLLIFGVLINISDSGHEVSSVRELSGLMKTRPILGAALLLGFLSLMGLPFTAIFMGKLLVILTSVESARWLLLGSLVLSSIIGLVVYIRLANVIFEEKHQSSALGRNVSVWSGSALATLALTAILLGIWPTLVTDAMPMTPIDVEEE